MQNLDESNKNSHCPSLKSNKEECEQEYNNNNCYQLSEKTKSAINLLFNKKIKQFDNGARSLLRQNINFFNNNIQKNNNENEDNKLNLLMLAPEIAISNNSKEKNDEYESKLLKTSSNTTTATNLDNDTLTKKTLETIENIKIKRNLNLETFSEINNKIEVKPILTSFSLKFKYEELLNVNRELPFPTHYKIIYQLFTYLENSLNFFKLRSKVPAFEDIKSTIETTYKQYINLIIIRKFTMNTLAQIFYIVPHFYVYKFRNSSNISTNASGSGDKLLIDIPFDYEKRLKVIHLFFLLLIFKSIY